MRNAQIEIPKEDTLAAAVGSNKALDDRVNAIEVLVELAERKSLIAKITGIGIVAGLILSFALPVRYKATSKVMPPQQMQSTSTLLMNPYGMVAGGTLSAMAGNALSLKNPNDIYIGLLNSRTIADSIIQKFDLMNVYRSKDMTAARKKLAEYTEVTSEKSGLISVSVEDRDKKRAAAIANEYMSQLRSLTKTLAVTEASQRRLFYEEELKQNKEALISAAQTFQQIQQNKGLVQLDAQARAMIQGLAVLRSQVAAKEVELQAIRSYSTDNNPQVQLVQSQLESLRNEELQMEKKGSAPGIFGLGLENIPSAGLEYIRAEHELAYRQSLYDILMKQYDAARIDEGKDAAIIQIVETAIEPDRSAFPKRGILITLFTLGGFLIGCIVAMFAWWRELIQSDPNVVWRLSRLRAALAIKKHQSQV
jgi:tyrosine-protein kinase Etk/Wzc